MRKRNIKGDGSLLSCRETLRAGPRVVIFDVGNVLIEWDMRHVYRPLFRDERKMTRFFEETRLASWNLEQDRGRGWDEAEQTLITEFPHYASEIRAFRACWHDMVPGEIAETVQLQQALLQTGVALYAVTNFALDTFTETQERFPFLRDFQDIVVSASVGIVKPDPAIFQCLLSRNNLNAADCLFIDDSEPNIAAACSLGMYVHHYRSAGQLEGDLRRHSLL